MIGLFSVFEVMKPQGNHMEELYGPGKYKLTYFVYIKHACFATLMKYILELRGTLFCENICLLTR
jgi:hypothetical protein